MNDSKLLDEIKSSCELEVDACPKSAQGESLPREERERLEKQIEAQRRLLETVVANAPVGIAVLGAHDQRIKWANTGFRVLTQNLHRSTSLCEDNLNDILSASASATLTDILRWVANTRQPYFHPEHAVESGLSEIYWRLSILPLSSEPDEPPDTLLLAADVTPQVAARRRVEELAAQAESSLARLEAVVSSMSEGVIICDLQGKITDVNPAALRIHGVEHEDNAHESFQQLHAHYEMRDLCGRLLPPEEYPIARVLRGETFSELELDVCRHDGQRKWVLSYSGTPVRTKTGEASLAVVTVRDITEHKKADLALRASEERFRFVARATNDVIWDWDLEKDEVVLSEAVQKAFGYASEQVKCAGSWWSEKVHPEDQDRVQNYVQRALEHGEEFFAGQYRFRRADGTYAMVLDRAFVWRDAAGKPVRMIGSMQDITDSRRAEEEIRRMNGELAAARDAAVQANQAKSRFLANMSHELRTPLNAIIGYSEMLEEDAGVLGQENFVSDLGKIKIAAKHLLSLINEVLDLSKIEAGRMSLHVEECDVKELLEDIMLTIQPLVAKNSNQFELCRSGSLGKMQTDTTKLRQVLFNLLSNAAKFTENGTVTLQALREIRGQRDWLEFRVCDTGIGMNEEQVQNLFESFYQADSLANRKYGGTGLGLALSKCYSQMLGGEVSVQSAPGKGSTFTVCLPAEIEAGDTPPQ